MISLSRSRKESSTAFFTHWLTAHSPPLFSATRRRPASRSSSTCSTASFTSAFADDGEISARRSKAPSMTCCMSLMHSLLLDEGGQPARGLDRVLDGGDQGHAHHPPARVHAVRLAAD